MPERGTATLDRPIVQRIEQPAAHAETGGEVKKDEILPIQQHAEEIKAGIRANDRVLVVGQPGAGKTKYVPEYLYDVVKESDPNAKVIVTQPRQLAVRTSANHMAERFPPGFIGYRYRHAREIRPNTRIEFTVDGSLLNDLRRDSTLSEYAGVMVDEVHERSVDIDIELALLKKAQAKRLAEGMNPLKIVVSSATMDKQKLADYFEMDPSGQFDIQGRLYPIDYKDNFLTTPLERDEVTEKAAETAVTVLQDDTKAGDLLIFMPGKQEIDDTIARLETQLRAKGIDPMEYDIIPLTGGKQDEAEQDRIFKKTGKRKVIVSTNVAETTITIDSVRVVIDSGLMKSNVYDPATGLTSLQTIEHTKANWDQRKGRAGRTQPGWAYPLFTEVELNGDDKDIKGRDPHPTPEIQRTDLAALVLRMKDIGIDNVYEFDFIDHPGKEALGMAEESLKTLGALDKDGKITDDIGREMMEIPEDPHFARMLVEAKRQEPPELAKQAVEAVSTVIGLISQRRSIFTERKGFRQKYAKYFNPKSDYLTLLNAWNDYVVNNTSKQANKEWTEKNGFHRNTLFEAGKKKNDLLRESIFHDLVGNIDRRAPHKPVDLQNEQLVTAIERSIAAGFQDKIVRRDADNTYSLLSGRRHGIELSNRSAISGRPEMMASQIREVQRQDGPHVYAELNQVVDQALLDSISKPQTSEVLPKLQEEQEVHAEIVPPQPEVTPVRTVREEVASLQRERDAELAKAIRRSIEQQTDFPERAREQYWYRKVWKEIKLIGKDLAYPFVQVGKAIKALGKAFWGGFSKGFKKGSGKK